MSQPTNMNEQSIADTVAMAEGRIAEVLERIYATGEPGLLSTRQIAWLEGEGLIERNPDYSYRVTEKGEREYEIPFEMETELDTTEDWLR